ncbi:MAG: VOC family protein [Alphaproteobacteria bacterium]
METATVARAARQEASVPFAIRELDHVVLRYRDVERGVRFYCEVLGCSVEKRRPDIGLVQLRAGASLIDLADVAGTIGRAGGAAPGKAARNLDHFCLRIEPWDAAAIARHLAAHGVGGGEPARRYGADGQGPSIYLFDPEGNQVELKGPPEG